MNVSDLSMSEGLASHSASLAATSADEMAIANAQRNLHQRLDHARTPRRAGRLAWAGAACAMVLAVALLALPLLSNHQGTAFAAVQAHLRNFDTLSMTITQQANGIDLPSVHVWTDKAGNTRSDIGGATTVIVNTDKHEMLVLLHASHQAMRMPLDAARQGDASKPLAWLDTVRNFQGRARHLAKTRLIDGVEADGWVLHASGMDITLWADPDGFPRAVDIGGRMQLHQKLKLKLNSPIDAARFSTRLPAGYSLMQPDQD